MTWKTFQILIYTHFAERSPTNNVAIDNIAEIMIKDWVRIRAVNAYGTMKHNTTSS